MQIGRDSSSSQLVQGEVEAKTSGPRQREPKGEDKAVL
jgi:hypothetical protein